MVNKNLMTENAACDRVGATICQLDITKDLITKPIYNNNSWFVFGRYKADNHIINILFHVMGMKVPIIGLVYQSVVTIFDETTGYYFAKDHIYPQNKTKISTDKFFIKVPNGSMSGSWENMKIHINESGIKVNLELCAIHYPILIGGNSIIDMCNMCIHEYSVPRMTTKGSISFNGRKYNLIDSGYAWFDRQWQNINYRHSTMKWTWLAISLDNGEILSVFDTDLKGFEDNIVAVLEPNGKQTNIRHIPRLIDCEKEYWISPSTKRKYPIKWEINISELDAMLEITSIKKEQEIKSVLAELNKYEGSCIVKGIYKGKQVTGHVLVEMIGPWLK